MISLHFATIIFDFLTNLSHWLFIRSILPVISAGGVTPSSTDLVNPAEAGCSLRCLLGRIIYTCLHTDHRLWAPVTFQESPIFRFGQILLHLPPDLFLSFRMFFIIFLLEHAARPDELRIFIDSPFRFTYPLPISRIIFEKTGYTGPYFFFHFRVLFIYKVSFFPIGENP